jgi:hypothetical protein
VTWFENIFLQNSAFPRHTEISIFAASDTLLPRLRKIVRYDVTQKKVRDVIEPVGGFVLVYSPLQSRSVNAVTGRVFTRKRVLEFSRTSLVFRIRMRNQRMRKLSSIPPRSRLKKRRRQSCYTWSAKDLSGLATIRDPAESVVKPLCERLQSRQSGLLNCTRATDGSHHTVADELKNIIVRVNVREL